MNGLFADLGTVLLAGGYDSTTEALIRTLHRQFLVIAVVLGLLVEGLLLYAMVRFHDNDDPEPTTENRRLEVAWTIGAAVVLLFVAGSSYAVLANPMVSSTPETVQPSDADVQVNLTGQNWFWSVSYPEENVTANDTVVLPVNQTVYFRVQSRDVIHSVHVPDLGIKQDALPGQTNTVYTRVTDTGTYRLYCAEFCGAGHSKMTATVQVVEQDVYRRWLQEHRNGSTNRSATSNRTTPDR